MCLFQIHNFIHIGISVQKVYQCICCSAVHWFFSLSCPIIHAVFYELVSTIHGNAFCIFLWPIFPNVEVSLEIRMWLLFSIYQRTENTKVKLSKPILYTWYTPTNTWFQIYNEKTMYNIPKAKICVHCFIKTNEMKHYCIRRFH